jgi:hypothetical protein
MLERKSRSKSAKIIYKIMLDNFKSFLHFNTLPFFAILTLSRWKQVFVHVRCVHIGCLYRHSASIKDEDEIISRFVFWSLESLKARMSSKNKIFGLSSLSLKLVLISITSRLVLWKEEAECRRLFQLLSRKQIALLKGRLAKTVTHFRHFGRTLSALVPTQAVNLWLRFP